MQIFFIIYFCSVKKRAMKCINDTFQRSLQTRQIRHIRVPTSCNSRISLSFSLSLSLSLCNSSPPSSLYPYVVFYVTGISIFLPRQRHNSARLFRVAFSPTLSFFQFYFTYDCTQCVFPFIFESQDPAASY